MYDLLLIDIKLPTINGLETYLAIKEINPGATAIIITGHREPMGHLVEQAISHSAYACLYKPLDLAKMLDLVDEIMARKMKASH
jgi:DNA-binding NtrC family response regulator